MASVEIHAALMDPLMAIANVVSEVLEATPPKLAGDLIDSGMVLTGGGCSRASTRCSQNARDDPPAGYLGPRQVCEN